MESHSQGATDGGESRGVGALSAPAIVLVSLAALGLLGWLGVTYFLPSCRIDPRRGAVAHSLRQVGITFALYEGKFKAFTIDPAVLERFAKETRPSDADTEFRCPGCGTGYLYLPAEGTFAPPGATPYSWKDGLITNGAPPDLPIAWHRCTKYPGDDFILFFQGRVDHLSPGSPADQLFQSLEHPAMPPK